MTPTNFDGESLGGEELDKVVRAPGNCEKELLQQPNPCAENNRSKGIETLNQQHTNVYSSSILQDQVAITEDDHNNEGTRPRQSVGLPKSLNYANDQVKDHNLSPREEARSHRLLRMQCLYNPRLHNTLKLM
ncbi:hypothetical protein RDI58_019796 [Solanum bulbocastanum]|uniref:Uncharacterized protein n=1 Tax=Solanum bulbocastanum TaxID=147425 RepID=A0AAN8T5C9_SOLBU